MWGQKTNAFSVSSLQLRKSAICLKTLEIAFLSLTSSRLPPSLGFHCAAILAGGKSGSVDESSGVAGQ